ncbi:homeodomain-like protein [Tanacetum coccineum]
MEESINKFMAESTKRHDKNYILFKEICSLTDFGIWNQGASIKALEIQIGQMSKVLQERGSRSLPSSTETNLRYHVNSISTTIKIDMTSICRIGGARYAILDNPNRMQTFKPNQLTIPFPCRLTNDCYEEMNVLDFATYGVFEEGRRMEDQVRRSVNEDPDLGASVSVMPLTTFTNLGLGDLAPTKLTVELANRTIKYPKGVAENVLVGIGKFVFPVDFVVLDMPEDIKVPMILGRPFLSTAHAKIDVFEREITLRVGNENVTFKSIKPTSSLIKRVYVLSLRERMKLDLEARLMGEALMINRSQDPSFEDFIELNDLNTPVELRRNQVEDLGPTIGDGEVINKPMIDIIKTRNDKSFEEYPSFCDSDWKIHIDCAYNLKFSCMIGFEHVNANFFLILSVNVMSKKFYNSIMKDKVEYKGKNVVGAFMNVPIFVGNFSVDVSSILP